MICVSAPSRFAILRPPCDIPCQGQSTVPLFTPFSAQGGRESSRGRSGEAEGLAPDSDTKFPAFGLLILGNKKRRVGSLHLVSFVGLGSRLGSCLIGSSQSSSFSCPLCLAALIRCCTITAFSAFFVTVSYHAPYASSPPHRSFLGSLSMRLIDSCGFYASG